MSILLSQYLYQYPYPYHHQSINITYFDHHSETVFSRNPTEKPDLGSHLESFCVLATEAVNAPELMIALRCPASIGVGLKAQRKTTTMPNGRSSLESMS